MQYFVFGAIGILSLLAGIMLEAVYGFAAPEDPDGLLKILLVVGGFGCLALAIGLGFWQIRQNEKKEAEREETNRIYMFTIISMLRRQRNTEPNIEPKPAPHPTLPPVIPDGITGLGERGDV